MPKICQSCYRHRMNPHRNMPTALMSRRNALKELGTPWKDNVIGPIMVEGVFLGSVLLLGVAIVSEAVHGIA